MDPVELRSIANLLEGLFGRASNVVHRVRTTSVGVGRQSLVERIPKRSGHSLEGVFSVID